MLKVFLLCIITGFLLITCNKPILTTKSNGGSSEEVYDCGGPDDGRFTIGANGIRLMYGFPIPASTSHFVIKVGDKYASNYKGLGNSVTHICTKKKMKTEGNRKFSEMEFKFEGISFVQRLIPVDTELKEVDSLKPARYYRIEYEFTNNKLDERQVGFMLLIDNMIADNDAPKLDGDGKMVDVETKFVGDNVPKQIFLYRTARDLSDHTAEMLTNQAQATKPDELAIGRWPYFHKVVWDYTPSGGTYTDAAVLMKWNPKPLGFNKKWRIATYYGMARKKDKQNKFIANDIAKMETVFSEKTSSRLLVDTAYFDNASSTLSKEFTTKIDQILAGRNLQKVVGVLIEGHTDAKGTDEANVEYSRKRAKAVIDYLAKKGISNTKTVPKGYGEMYATQSDDTQKNGNAKDRKAILVMYLQEN
jgi:outer membrane protein OmpA-like peptidoglycan-associated protein